MGFWEKINKPKREETKKLDTEIKDNNDKNQKNIIILSENIKTKYNSYNKEDLDIYIASKYENLKKQVNFLRLGDEVETINKTQKAYIFCLFYIDQLAQTKTRSETTQEEKEFLYNFQSMSQSLWINYELPAFKESIEFHTTKIYQ